MELRFSAGFPVFQNYKFLARKPKITTEASSDVSGNAFLSALFHARLHTSHNL
jgi:hypothetical protein